MQLRTSRRVARWDSAAQRQMRMFDRVTDSNQRRVEQVTGRDTTTCHGRPALVGVMGCVDLVVTELAAHGAAEVVGVRDRVLKALSTRGAQLREPTGVPGWPDVVLGIWRHAEQVATYSALEERWGITEVGQGEHHLDRVAGWAVRLICLQPRNARPSSERTRHNLTGADRAIWAPRSGTERQAPLSPPSGIPSAASLVCHGLDGATRVTRRGRVIGTTERASMRQSRMLSFRVAPTASNIATRSLVRCFVSIRYRVRSRAERSSGVSHQPSKEHRWPTRSG